MKEAFWGYFVIALGLFVLVVLFLVQRLTVSNEEDFYLTREVLEASMIDAVDYGSYRLTGRVVMSAEKFQEVFIRRFAESISNNKAYTLEFYDIYEDPPKATVRVRTSSGTSVLNSDSFGISIDTLLSGILETVEVVSNEPILAPEKPDIDKTSTIDIDFDKIVNKTIPDKWCYSDEAQTIRIHDVYCDEIFSMYDSEQTTVNEPILAPGLKVD